MAARGKPAPASVQSKAAHTSVAYGSGDRQQHCSICARYIAPGKDGEAHCKDVVDPISARMWCVRFERAA